MPKSNKDFVRKAQELLKLQGHSIPLGHLYEVFANLAGFADWNTASAKGVSFGFIAPDAKWAIRTDGKEWPEFGRTTADYNDDPPSEGEMLHAIEMHLAHDYGDHYQEKFKPSELKKLRRQLREQLESDGESVNYHSTFRDFTHLCGLNGKLLKNVKGPWTKAQLESLLKNGLDRLEVNGVVYTPPTDQEVEKMISNQDRFRSYSTPWGTYFMRVYPGFSMTQEELQSQMDLALKDEKSNS